MTAELLFNIMIFGLTTAFALVFGLLLIGGMAAWHVGELDTLREEWED